MKSSNGNRNSCPQGGMTPLTSTNWGPAGWETTLQVKTWEVLVDNKLTMSQWCFLTASNIMGWIKKSFCRQREKEEGGFDSSFLTKHCCHLWKLDWHLVSVSDTSCQC